MLDRLLARTDLDEYDGQPEVPRMRFRLSGESAVMNPLFKS